MISSARKRYLIPLVTAGLGLAALGTGIGMAAAGSEAALLAVGSSNLAMVLSLVGAAAVIPSIFAFYILASKDELKMKGMVEEHGLGINAYALVMPAIAGIVMAAATYGMVHLGMSQSLSATLDTGGSLAVQAVIGLGVGMVISLATFSVILCFEGADVRSLTPYQMRNMMVSTAIGGGLLGCAATVVGPALTAAMGMAASSTEAIVLESLITVGITALFAFALKIGMIWNKEDYFGKDPVSEYTAIIPKT